MNKRTPGVYIEEISKLPASVAGGETAVPAFIGYTEKAEENGDLTALRNKPTRITSLQDYREKFGEARKELFNLEIEDEFNQKDALVKRTFGANPQDPSPFILYYSLQLYFSNGGDSCYIVSVGDYSSGSVEAGSADDGTGLLGGIRALEKTDEPTLLLFPDAVNLKKASDFGRVVAEALSQCNKLKNRFTIIDRYNGDTNLSEFRELLGTSNLSYGAVYHPFLKTSLNYQVDEDSVISHKDHSGKILTNHGKKLKELQKEEPGIYRSLLSESRKVNVELPPSGAIAGIYARVDRNRGVWKAPANVSINSVIAPVKNITHQDQTALNVDEVSGKSINAIRTFTGKGTLVWGARTLAGNDNEWRYVPVRRLCIYIETSVKRATEFVITEPNDANRWVRVRAMIENFLTGLWRDGALAGGKPDDAFFVKVGLGETMTPQDIQEGRMIVEIGLAAVRPAEFIILRFIHKLPEA